MSEQQATTKIMTMFFPMKPMLSKFNEDSIYEKISSFIPSLKSYTDKAIIYKIKTEKFYSFNNATSEFNDLMTTRFENKTVVIVFSIDKNITLDTNLIMQYDLSQYAHTIRVHRKKIISPLYKDPSYIFYTINSTNLLNKILVEEKSIENMSAIRKGHENTFFVMSSKNSKAKANTISPYTTEKICPASYVKTAFFEKEADKDIKYSIRKKLSET